MSLSPPGDHIIASAPTNTLSAKAFARCALDLATRLSQLDIAQAHGARQSP